MEEFLVGLAGDTLSGAQADITDFEPVRDAVHGYPIEWTPGWRSVVEVRGACESWGHTMVLNSTQDALSR